MGDEFADVMGHLRLATERTAESFAALDVAGMNYGDGAVLDRSRDLSEPHHRGH